LENLFKSGTLLVFKRGSIMEKKKPIGIVYECIRCGAKVPSEDLELRGGNMKCIVCGYRVLKKIRPPVVKRVSTK
jgi:DNA-directed RNA polymerase subunit RPC12/RpoP